MGQIEWAMWANEQALAAGLSECGVAVRGFGGCVMKGRGSKGCTWDGDAGLGCGAEGMGRGLGWHSGMGVQA